VTAIGSGKDKAACSLVVMKWFVRPAAGGRDAVDCNLEGLG
jgi:hypothetical protein